MWWTIRRSPRGGRSPGSGPFQGRPSLVASAPNKLMHDLGVTLRDGSLATVRPIRPDDGEFLRAVFERLSDESRYRRFLSRGSQLSDPVVRDLTHVDHHDHEALVAAADDGTVMGVARYVRLPRDPEAAEAAVAIVCQSVVAVILRRDGLPYLRLYGGLTRHCRFQRRPHRTGAAYAARPL